LVELRETNGSVTLRLRVQPRAARTEISGELGGAIKLRIAAPPVDGKANDECRRFLARLFGVNRNAVEIVAGDSSRDKVVRIHGVTANSVLRRLSDQHVD